MSDSVLGKYTNRRDATIDETDTPTDGDSADDLGAFGILRGVRDRCAMLELRKKTGDIVAVAYGYMDRAEFDPSRGIVLHLGGQKILITGRNLNAEARPQVRLFQQITRHRVAWIREADQGTDLEADDKQVVIESIEW